jgi:hypothetical protein
LNALIRGLGKEIKILLITRKTKDKIILSVMIRVSPVFVFRLNILELEKHDVHWHFVLLYVKDFVEQEIL